MKQLSLKSVQSIENFMSKFARPLDFEVYNFFFKDGDFLKALGELKKFQNNDGGFGHGIEPDIRLPLSSPMATTVGLQYLVLLDCPLNHEMVSKSIEYLVSEYDASRKGWWSTPKEISDYPHAPWWNKDDEARIKTIESWFNPCSEITGYIHMTKNLVPENILTETLNIFLQKLNEFPPDFSGHDFLCCARALPFLPDKEQKIAFSKLRLLLKQSIETDAQKWSDYCIPPNWLIRNRESLFYSELKNVIDNNIEWVIDTLKDDGSWHPNWAWGKFESEWIKAEQEWKGHLTLMNMLFLNGFDRIPK